MGEGRRMMEHALAWRHAHNSCCDWDVGVHTYVGIISTVVGSWLIQFLIVIEELC